MSFCSIACQANEASKPTQQHGDGEQLNDYYFYNSSISSSRSTCSTNSDISFQRRLSFSSLSSFQPTPPTTRKTNNKSNNSKNPFLFTNNSIFLLDRMQNLNKHCNQNVYTNYFFSWVTLLFPHWVQKSSFFQTKIYI